LSDIGGIFSTLFVVGKVIVGLYLDKLFYSKIISEIYQEDLSRKDLIEEDEKVQRLKSMKKMEN